MSIGLVGRKVGMTRIFTDDGGTTPVTVLDVSDNRVTQVKTAEADGYAAVQVAFGKRRATRVNKALAGHLAKAGVEAGHTLREFRAKAEELANLKPGAKPRFFINAGHSKHSLAHIDPGLDRAFDRRFGALMSRLGYTA